MGSYPEGIFSHSFVNFAVVNGEWCHVVISWTPASKRSLTGSESHGSERNKTNRGILVFEIRLLDTRSVVCLKAHEHAASYYRRMFDFVTLFTTAVHCLKNSLTVSIAALHLREVRATGTLFLPTWWRNCLTRFFVRMRLNVFCTFIFKKPCESLTSFPHDEACVVPTSSLKCEISDCKWSEVLSTLGEHMTACVFPKSGCSDLPKYSRQAVVAWRIYTARCP